jgi:hypothetical protein
MLMLLDRCRRITVGSLPAVLAVFAVAALAATLAAASGIVSPATEGETRTLAYVNDQISGFDQDGDVLVWSAERGQGCTIVMQDVSSGRRQTIARPASPDLGDACWSPPTVAGTRALWISESVEGNWTSYSMSVAGLEQRPRVVDETGLGWTKAVSLPRSQVTGPSSRMPSSASSA